MLLKGLVALIVAIALVCVAIGVGVILLTGSPPVTPPVIPPGTAPTVTLTSPLNAATGSALNTKVVATFSKPMDPSTINSATFKLMHGTTAVAGTVTYVGTTATFAPSGNLAPSLAHTATVTTGAKDASGRALAANFVWSFTTGVTADTTAPLVSFTSPASGASGTPINAKVLATFSEPMDASTITAATFTLKQGTTSVSGTVSLSGATATFVPSASFASSTGYTASITTGAKDLAGNALRTAFAWSFTSGLAPDTTAPRVSSTSPLTPVGVNSNISATFTEVVDPATVTTSTFTLKQGSTPVPGVVTYAGLTATFNPASAFAASTTYAATITTGVRDLAGNALANNFAWTFTTAAGTVCDCTPPVVSATSPHADATDVAFNSAVSASFSKALDPSTVTVSTFLLMQGTTPVQGLVSYAGVTATFDPSSDLAADTPYTATITTGVRDLAGNALQANFAWNFRTGQVRDTTAPLVTSTSPAAGAVDVSVSSAVSATFSEGMDPSTVTVSTFLLMQGTTPVSGLVGYAGLTATFRPDSALSTSTLYTATMTTGAKDLAGNALQSAFSWSFTTAAPTSACAQSTVALGLAAPFAVLGGATVTNTGPTTVTGDLGASPGTEVTGFPPGTVVGSTHAGDSVAVSGLADLTTAYNDAAGRTLCAITVDGNLGGQTLTPGLYKSGSSLEISSGDLTLDAQGDANAIFIFQMPSTLTTTIGRQVILTGGAKASNVFWQVGSSATIGVNSTFVGTILADQSITLTTGATLDGRALARIGAVTLDSNMVTKPAA